MLVTQFSSSEVSAHSLRAAQFLWPCEWSENSAGCFTIYIYIHTYIAVVLLLMTQHQGFFHLNLPPFLTGRASFPGRPGRFWKEWVSLECGLLYSYGVLGSWNCEDKNSISHLFILRSSAQYFQTAEVRNNAWPCILLLVFWCGLSLMGCVEEAFLSTHWSRCKSRIVEAQGLTTRHIEELNGKKSFE